MFLARRGKQSHRKENSKDALANEGSHNALAQLSVSRRRCKTKARWAAQASCLWGVRASRLNTSSLQTFDRLEARRPHRQDACASCAESFGYDYEREYEQEQEAVEEERVMIETRRCGITITCGGPHRKTQRTERSFRSRSAFCRHVAVFRADFLHAEGYTVVALV